MKLIYLKSILMFFIFVCSVIVSLIPLSLSKSKRFKVFAKIGNTFAAGIFLGLTFLHLIPESSELLSSINYPISGLISVISYLLMLFIEKVALADHSIVSHGKRHADLGCHCESNHTDEEEDKLIHILSTRERLYSHINEGNGENCEKMCKEHLTEPFLPNEAKTPLSTSLILAGVLSLHSLIEGATLGIQNKYKPFINLSAGIFIHKLPESLVIGITLKSIQIRLRNSMILVYSLATPLGILIGTLVNTYESPVIEGVLVSSCIGTFIYVAASEILIEEFAVSKLKFQKFLATLLGLTFIAFILLIEGHISESIKY